MSTANDRAVLNLIFNPLLPTPDVLQQEIPEELENDEEEVENEGVKESKRLEVEGVKAAEAGRLEEAIQRFSEAATVAPTRASPYNNRAQALRLKGDIPGALNDIETGLRMCGGRGKTGCLLFCQRGVVYRAQSQDNLARADFQLAADLGSAFAKQQLIQMNPYAAMCNQMLKDMMSKLTSEQPVLNGST